MKFRAAARLSAIAVSRLDRPAAFVANHPATGRVAVASAATALRGSDPVVRRTIDVVAGRWAAPKALGPGMTPTAASARNGLVGLLGGRASGTAVTVHNASIGRRQVRAAGVEGTVAERKQVPDDPCATRATGGIVRHGPTVASGPGLIGALGMSVRHGPTGKSGQVEIAASGVILPAGLSRHEVSVQTVPTVPIGVSVRHGRIVQEEIAASEVNLPAGLSRHEATVPTVPTAHGANGPAGPAKPQSSADALLTAARTRSVEGGRPKIEMTPNARTSNGVRVAVG
jgi:hypothetical protein